MSSRRIEAQAVISAKDATGGVFSQVAAKMRSLDQQAKAVGKGAAAASANSKALEAATSSWRTSAAIGAAARFVAPAALAYGAKKSVDNFNSLETSMVNLGNTAEASEDQIARAMQTFRRQGPPLGVTAKEMSAAAGQFVAAGLDFNTAVNAVTPAVKAAKASGGEVSDMADAGVAVMQQYGFRAETLGRAFDIMAKAGKLGRVELKDMAKLMPAVGVGAKRMGLEGEKGLAKSTAALEILREGVATAEEAANRWENVVQKAFIQETQKHFKKFGVNLEKEIKDGLAKGKDALESMLDATERVTKGDEFKLGQLFNDQQAMQGMQLLLRNRQKLRDYTNRILSESAGTVGRDFERVAQTGTEAFKRLEAAADRAVGRIGQGLAPAAGRVADALNDVLDKIDKGETALSRMERTAKGRAAAAGHDPELAERKSLEESEAIQNMGRTKQAMLKWLFPSGSEIETSVRDQQRADLLHDQRRAVELEEIVRRLKEGGASPRIVRDMEERQTGVEGRLENRRRYEQTTFRQQRELEAASQRLAVQQSGARGAFAPKNDKLGKGGGSRFWSSDADGQSGGTTAGGYGFGNFRGSGSGVTPTLTPEAPVQKIIPDPPKVDPSGLNPLQEKLAALKQEAAEVNQQIAALGSNPMDMSGAFQIGPLQERARELQRAIKETEDAIKRVSDANVSPTFNAQSINDGKTAAEEAGRAVDDLGRKSASPTFDAQGINQGKTAVEEAGRAVDDLGRKSASPTFGLSGIQAFNAEVRTGIALMGQLEAKANSAVAAAGRVRAAAARANDVGFKDYEKFA